MGYGSYRASDWQRLKNSRNLGSSSTASQTFKKSEISDKLNSRYIKSRESIDSSDSPNSTPLIIGFDVTGSMGYLANEIATKSLNATITKIISDKVVSDPHIMCAAFTDPFHPLQITQYEADIRVIEQLLDFSLGGCNRFAYDNLLWYFAANHTRIDSFEKRNKKGILIGIGDEICGEEINTLAPEFIKNCFDDDVKKNYGFTELYEEASTKYEIAHIVIGEDYRISNNGGDRCSYTGWKEACPGRVAKIHAKDVEYLSSVIIAVIKFLSGVSKKDIIKSLDTYKEQLIVEKAIEDMYLTENDSALNGNELKANAALKDPAYWASKSSNAVSDNKDLKKSSPSRATATNKDTNMNANKASNPPLKQPKKKRSLGDWINDFLGNRK